MKNRSNQTFWDHVLILRRYVLISFLGLVAGASLVHHHHARIIEFLFRPLGDVEAVFLSPLDPFIFIFKVDLFGGLLLALPVMIICAFVFVAPALDIDRIGVLVLFSVVSFALILGAISYTFLLLVPLSLGFLLSIEVPGIANQFTAQSYLNFVLMQLYMSIGVSLIPLVVVVATLIHILNPYRIGAKRGILYLGMAIVLAFLTPTTDLFSLAILLIPALALFEVGVLIAKGVYSFQHRQNLI